MKRKILTVLLAGAALTQAGFAGTKSKAWKSDPKQQEIIGSQTFLSDHPDMLNRLRAMEALERGDLEGAAQRFRQASRYADKQSQAAYAEMLWEGKGVPKDRAMAYAWMDLAAERGYTVFLGIRERYWNELDATERARAIEEGQKIYAEYGDAVAQPRMEKILNRARRKITGSRVGFVGRMTIKIPGPSGEIVISGYDYYAKEYWDPAKYWHWQAEIIEGAREGVVTSSDIEVRQKSEKGKSKNDE